MRGGHGRGRASAREEQLATRAGRRGQCRRTRQHPERTRKDQAVLFYGIRGANGYLSQMYTSDIVLDGNMFFCNEQYFQHAKAVLFGDEANAERIMAETSPFRIKALGRKVSPFVEEQWNVGRD
jgi:predicted NAD-dependent protein-ADP-ribosyltransferase YbiA (DUF1768 family)